jgi:uncharacterized protein (UPF0264 family)
MTDRRYIDSSPGLLVSVRDVDEAEAALAGGADIIDVKDPSRGPLGKADDDVIAEIVQQVNGRRPVSAALGELDDWNDQIPIRLDPGLRWVKIGLADQASRSDWRQSLNSFRYRIEAQGTTGLVAVAYADWRRANAPRPDDVAGFAVSERFAGLLIDTWHKDGSTLLDWMTLGDLIETCDHFRRVNVPIALAGALGRSLIRRLQPVRPAWFALRGSACNGGRDGRIDTERVRRLVLELSPEHLIKESP